MEKGRHLAGFSGGPRKTSRSDMDSAAGMWARWGEEEGGGGCVAFSRGCPGHTSVRPLWQELEALSCSVLDTERGPEDW